MSPFLLFTAFAALLGFSVHKRWWGSVAFAIALLVWLMLIQVLSAYMLHPVSN